MFPDRSSSLPEVLPRYSRRAIPDRSSSLSDVPPRYSLCVIPPRSSSLPLPRCCVRNNK